jgi:hypothetical protein
MESLPILRYYDGKLLVDQHGQGVAPTLNELVRSLMVVYLCHRVASLRSLYDLEE